MEISKPTTRWWILRLLLCLSLSASLVSAEADLGPVVLPPSTVAPNDSVYIAGLFDLTNFLWTEELFNFTVNLINNHTDGWMDDVLVDTFIETSLADVNCDTEEGVKAYLEVTRKEDSLPNGIMGASCSGPTMAISTIASVEGIAVVSPSATNPKLSNKMEYGTFSRLVAPDDASGQVGALVTLLRSFGWERINIINSDTDYATDLKIELTKEWEGEQFGFTGQIGYTATVQVDQETNQVNRDSIFHVLSNLPVTKPSINSRVIVLLAHDRHAFPVLEMAQHMNLQPDTIWIGVDAWADRASVVTQHSWMPLFPGYIGLVPYRNVESPVQQDYLQRLQASQQERNVPVFPDVPDSTAERMIDSILALAMALSNVSPDERRDGIAVARAVRQLEFEGVSGLVEFNELGDWAAPKYAVMTLPYNTSDWVSVGWVSPGHAEIDFSRICYPVIGCGQPVPSEKYPMPVNILVISVASAMGGVVIVLLLFAYFLHRRPKNLKEKIRLLETDIQGVISHDNSVQRKKGRLYREMASLLGQPPPAAWTGEQRLNPVSPTEKEYWDVLDKIRKTTADGETCHIAQLSRVQNEGIWSSYVYRKNQLANKHGIDFEDILEEDVWHGTSGLPPGIILNDSQDGFMVNYSQQGMYGRGIYFADRFGYSDSYSYRMKTERGEDRQIFLVKLLVGKAALLNHFDGDGMEHYCKSLVAPPTIPGSGGVKYDTVTGVGDMEHMTKIHVVYENGRAYPEYLVQYYKGPRDSKRTPYESREEAMGGLKSTRALHVDSTAKTEASDSGEASDSLVVPDLEKGPQASNRTPIPVDLGECSQSSQSVQPVRSNALWMYCSDGDGEQLSSTWAPFDLDLSDEIESTFQRDPHASVEFEQGPWTYHLDLNGMVQINLEHPDRRRRNVRRVELR